MADNNTDPKAAKLQKDLEAQHKKTEACCKEVEKGGALSKKALKAAKTVDELWK
jgi:hypothetical protein